MSRIFDTHLYIIVVFINVFSVVMAPVDWIKNNLTEFIVVVVNVHCSYMYMEYKSTIKKSTLLQALLKS